MSKSTKVALHSVCAAVMVLGTMIFAGCSSNSSNGTTPAAAGQNSVAVSKATLPVGDANCPTGGISVSSGIDTNGNGILDASEVTNTQYVCNGADGTKGTNGTNGASVTTSVEPAGANCANGGTKVSVAGGTPPVTYVCNGTNGTNGTAGVPETTYKATIYMANEVGGHIGSFPVTIDPTDPVSPIKVDQTDPAYGRIVLKADAGNANNTVHFHDVRLDGNKIYYSSFNTSPNISGGSKAYIGYVDITTAKVDGTPNQGTNSFTTIDASAADTIGVVLSMMTGGTDTIAGRMVYCASAQATVNGVDYYMPMTMSFPAYIDVFKKSDLALHTGATVTPVQRTYISSVDNSTPYLAFLHGNVSPDGTKMYAATNEVSGTTTTNNLSGHVRAYLFNTADLVTGTLGTSAAVTTSATYTVAPLLASIAFRSSYSADGNYILQATKDRLLVLQANSLKLYDDASVVGLGGKFHHQNHDVITTPDSKYAILSLYYANANTDTGVTAGVALYDIANKQFIGGITPTCGICHSDTTSAAHNTCGLVAKWK